MAHYILQVSHSEKDCLRALNEIMAHSLHMLNHSWFACTSGVHTSWMDVEADSTSMARNSLPPSIRSSAQVVEVQRFTAEQIKGMHGH